MRKMERLLAVIIAVFMTLSMTGLSAIAASGEAYEVLSGSVTLRETAVYADGVTIAEDAEITAAEEEYTVVMTVDGVQQDIEPGVYEGEVVFSVVKLVQDYYVSPASTTLQTMTVALSIKTDEDGNQYIDTDESVTAALVGGTYDAYSAQDITIVSNGDNFGGIRVGGDASYTIENLTIILNGNGSNDFTGAGAAIAACDNAKVTVKNVTIITTGALRMACFAGDYSELLVEDSSMEAHSLWAEENVLLEDVDIPTADHPTPPAGLGVYGNNRAAMVVDYATVTFKNCEIVTDSWGAAGSDNILASEDEPTYMYLTGCTITAENASYGAYSIGYIWDIIEDTTIDAANGMGVIVSGEGCVQLTNATINSNRFGIVAHQGEGAVSEIVITEESAVNAKYTGILIKERGADITVSDGSVIRVDDGAMIQAVVNDDTGAGSMTGTETITVSVSNTALEGDILQSLPAVPMTVTLTGASVTGAVSMAEPTFMNGGSAGSEVEERYEVGVIIGNTLEALDGTELNLVLEDGSQWIVTETSYLTALTVDETSSIDGVVTVDGVETAVEAGVTYTGNIVVTAA